MFIDDVDNFEGDALSLLNQSIAKVVFNKLDYFGLASPLQFGTH
jgi:hypothetical protein